MKEASHARKMQLQVLLDQRFCGFAFYITVKELKKCVSGIYSFRLILIERAIKYTSFS